MSDSLLVAAATLEISYCAFICVRGTDNDLSAIIMPFRVIKLVSRC